MLSDLEKHIPLWLPQNNPSFHLMGHSMGGRLAMQYAIKHPKQLQSLVVVDMGVQDTQKTFPVLDVAITLDLKEYRGKPYNAFVQHFQEQGIDGATSQFMVTNLQKNKEGEYSWQIPLPVLHRAQAEVVQSPIQASDRCSVPSLFLMGENSDVVSKEDEAGIHKAFPQANIKWLEGSGHNPHFEARNIFVQELIAFLS